MKQFIINRIIQSIGKKNQNYQFLYDSERDIVIEITPSHSGYLTGWEFILGNIQNIL